MMLLDKPPEALFDHVGVDLRRRDVGMTQELLHGAQVGAALEQVAGEGVAQHVRRDARRLDPRRDRQRLELLTEALARQMLAPGRRKEPSRYALAIGFVLAHRGEMGRERFPRRIVERNEPLPPPFAL